MLTSTDADVSENQSAFFFKLPAKLQMELIVNLDMHER